MFQMTVALDSRYGTDRSLVEDCESEVHKISPGTCVLVVVLVLYTIVPPDTIQTYKVGYVAEMAVAICSMKIVRV